MHPAKKFNPKQSNSNPWILFILGLAIGVAAFASYHYFSLRRDIRETLIGGEGSGANNLVDFKISTGTDHIWGKRDAGVTIVTFNDFTCPYCQEQSKNLEIFMADNLDKVRIVWRHFPLSLESSLAMSAANAAECAGDQGQFWNYAQKLYAHQDSLGPELYYALADEFRLNRARFEDCFESGKYFHRIEADYDEGIAKGVTGTPNNFINGRLIPYALTVEQLKSLAGVAN